MLFDAVGVVEDHLGADACERGKPLLEQVEGHLGVAPGYTEFAARLDVCGTNSDRRTDRHDHPHHHDGASVTRTETGEPLEARCHRHHLARTATRWWPGMPQG